MGKMLVTAAILGCISPILTTVGLLGQKLLRPARLASEKYQLHAFYRQFYPNGDSDHLLMHRLFLAWKSNSNLKSSSPYDSTLSVEITDSRIHKSTIGRHESLLSRAALRRLDESRYQIYRELCNNFGAPHLQDMTQCERHSQVEGLIRLTLASGFYPEVAVSRDKRNLVRLAKVPMASLVPSSIAYVLGRGVVTAWMEETGMKKDPCNLTQHSMTAKYFVYEELLDLGQKLVSKVTAVDPLSLVLFARNLEWQSPQDRLNKPSPSKLSPSANNADGQGTLLVLDNFIRLQDASGCKGDLRLIAELRGHWNDFLQFYINKRLAGLPFEPAEQAAVNQFVELIVAFAQELNVDRPVLRTNITTINGQTNPNHHATSFLGLKNLNSDRICK